MRSTESIYRVPSIEFKFNSTRYPRVIPVFILLWYHLILYRNQYVNLILVNQTLEETTAFINNHEKINIHTMTYIVYIYIDIHSCIYIILEIPQCFKTKGDLITNVPRFPVIFTSIKEMVYFIEKWHDSFLTIRN